MESEAVAPLLPDLIHLDHGRLDLEAVRALNALEWDMLVGLSRAHGVFTQVHTRLSEPDLISWVPETVLNRLRQAKLYNVERNLRIRLQLRELLAAFDKAGLPVIVLKGAYLAEHVYESPAQRYMSDIDLLVPPATLRIVELLLQSLGYYGTVTTGNERPFKKPDTIATLDLHWSLTHPVWHPSIIDSELWERSESIRFGEIPAKVLSNEDLLLHLCMHASYQNRFVGALRILLDMAMVCIAASQTIDWGTVLRQATTLRLCPGAYLSLRLAKDMVGAPIPEELLDNLSRCVASSPVKLAEELVLTIPPTPTGINNFAKGYGPVAAMRMILARLRGITRHEIANRYGGSETTVWLPGYYLRCVGDMARNYKTLKQIAIVRDPEVRSYVNKANVIMGFLEGNVRSGRGN